MRRYELRQGGTSFPLRQGDTLVGRSAYCTILLQSPRASRRHFLLTLTGDDLYASDLGSANGTSVNGTRITGLTRLSPGDRISVGDEGFDVAVTEQDPQAGLSRPTTRPGELNEATTTETTITDLEMLLPFAPRLMTARDGNVELESLRETATVFFERWKRVPLSATELDRLRGAFDPVARSAPDARIRAWCEQLLATAASASKS